MESRLTVRSQLVFSQASPLVLITGGHTIHPSIEGLLLTPKPFRNSASKVAGLQGHPTTSDFWNYLRKIILNLLKTLKKALWPLFMVGIRLPQGYSHFEEAVHFLPLSSQKFLVLILPTSKGWKAESAWTRLSWIWNPLGD